MLTPIFFCHTESHCTKSFKWPNFVTLISYNYFQRQGLIYTENQIKMNMPVREHIRGNFYVYLWV